MSRSRFAVGLVAIFVISAVCVAADDTITLLAGRELHVQFITELSSKANETGDMFTGKVVEPVFGPGGEVVPEGSTVDGHITFVNPPEQAKGKGKDKEKGDFLLIADSISTPGGTKYNIVANAPAAGGAPTKDQAAGSLNALASKFSTKKGKNITIAAGTEVTFEITHDTVATKVPVKQ
ncbi:MAG: hypothetical protein ABSF46_07840 [Terriglobia bacterium]